MKKQKPLITIAFLKELEILIKNCDEKVLKTTLQLLKEKQNESRSNQTQRRKK